VGNAMEHRGRKETMRQIARNDMKQDVTEIDETSERAWNVKIDEERLLKSRR